MNSYIFGNSRYIQVGHSNPIMPWVGGSFSSSATRTEPGQIRYNGSSNRYEVSDGQSWLAIPATTTNLELSPEVQNILDWARQKMTEELNLAQLMSKYPALKDAHDQFQVVKHLVTQENNT